MTITLLASAPSDFVRFLVEPGLASGCGPVALNRYVSGRHRSPRASAMYALLNGLLNRHPGRTDGAGLAALRRARGSIVASGRPSSWRRVFTGQGQPEHIQSLWQFILANREFLLTLESDRVHAGSRRPFEHYFGSGGNPLVAMVNDEIFGYDCLGFVGNYLCWAHGRDSYPECSAAGYVERLQFEAISGPEQIEPLTVLLWVTTGTQHIAIVDRVHAQDSTSALVDICQSSAGGPQTNQRVELRKHGDTTVVVGESEMQQFRFYQRGTPAVPVASPMVIAKHRGLRLNRPA